MPRHARYVPHGVIPAVLLPFNDDLSIDEKSFRAHLRDVAATKGISAITINAHSTEVASLPFEEPRTGRALERAGLAGIVPVRSGIRSAGTRSYWRMSRLVGGGCGAVRLGLVG